MEQTTETGLCLGPPEHLRLRRALSRCGDPRSAVNHNLMVKYNDLLIFSLIANYVIFCKVKINCRQHSSKIWLFCHCLELQKDLP